MLSVFSVLIDQSTLRFLATGDLSMNWLAVRALCSDSPLPTTASDTVSRLELKLDLKERTTTNKIKRELAQTAAAELLSNKSHATANVSLLAH